MRKIRASVNCILLLGLIVSAGAAWAASNDDTGDNNPHLWKPRTHSVAVFKNGLGFFMRRGDVRLRDGWCVAKQIPPAAFGTLAIYSHDENQIVDIVGSGSGEVVEFDGRDAADDVETKRKRLNASLNLKVQLHYKHKGEDRNAAGKLVSVGPKFAVLDSGTNSFAVPVDGIRKIQILELPLRIHTVSEDKKSGDKARLGMAYLRKGITWIPEYTLKVIDEETAELTLRGTVVNEAEDLVHTDVHLVVGVPHFVHTEYMAPIAVGQVIRAIGSSMAPKAAMTQQMMNRAALVGNNYVQIKPEGVVNREISQPDDTLKKAVGNLPQLGGAAATDYTVYTKKDLTLRRGEKAIVTLFVKKIKYSHIYRWSPPSAMRHSLVLHNQTDTPLTTGPCLAISNGRPLSEDLLKYTPKGGNGDLPVTAAINISHHKSEREIERKLKAHSPSTNVHFDLVTLEGKLTLRNYEKRAVRIVIDNPIPGKPIDADDKGCMSVDPAKLKLLERAGSIEWTVEIEPGQDKTLTYRYERYVPSQ
ncbi:MAG: hypothetical protein JXM70_28800 [Pirellulales bacterium]|nr:hypothetical protein [Pirellulales bacterium]